MSRPIGLWRERLITDASSTTATQQSDLVPPGEIWYLKRLALRDDTTSGADVVVSIVTAGYQHVLYHASNLTAGEWTSVNLEIFLREGERLQFDWSSVAANDRLTVHLTGEKRLDEQAAIEVA